MAKIFEIKQCPYCKTENQIDTEDWERVRCPSCKGVYYAEVHSKIVIRALNNNGKGVEHTQEG